jgi:hypothetical protein
MDLTLVASMMFPLRRERLRFLDLLVKMCPPKAFSNLNFPEPVTLKRFAADLFVLIFGILNISLITPYALYSHPETIGFQPNTYGANLS